MGQLTGRNYCIQYSSQIIVESLCLVALRLFPVSLLRLPLELVIIRRTEIEMVAVDRGQPS